MKNVYYLHHNGFLILAQRLVQTSKLKLIYFILVNNRLYMLPNEGINWPLWHRSVKNLPSNGWVNYSNNGIKHYFIKENHTL
jgi:hypothetical protein